MSHGFMGLPGRGPSFRPGGEAFPACPVGSRWAGPVVFWLPAGSGRLGVSRLPGGGVPNLKIGWDVATCWGRNGWKVRRGAFLSLGAAGAVLLAGLRDL